MQKPLGAKVTDPQVSLSLKELAFVPAIEIPVTIKGAVPVLLRVID